MPDDCKVSEPGILLPWRGVLHAVTSKESGGTASSPGHQCRHCRQLEEGAVPLRTTTAINLQSTPQSGRSTSRSKDPVTTSLK